MRSKISWKAVGLLLAAWALLTIHIDASWFGHHKQSNIRIGAVIRNYQRYGALNLGFKQLRNFGPFRPGAEEFYTHHPPLPIWTAALSVAAFGFHEVSFRFVNVSATLLALAAFYVLNRRLWGSERAWWAAAFLIFTPMIAYYGGEHAREPLSFTFGLAFAAVLVNWLRRPTRGRWLALAGLACFSVWSAWGGVLLLGILGLAALLLARPDHRPHVILLGIIAGLALLAFFGYYLIQREDAVAQLFAVFRFRSSDYSKSVVSERFTSAEFLQNQITYLLLLSTPGLLIMGAVGSALSFREEGKTGKVLLSALFLTGIAYLILLRNAAYLHDFYQIYLYPALAMAASAACARAKGRVRLLLTALAASSAIFCVYMTLTLHRTEDQPLMIREDGPVDAAAFVEAMQRRTQPEDLLLSDLPVLAEVSAFYAARNVKWSVLPADVPAYAKMAGEGLVYVNCIGERPAEFEGYPSIQDICDFIRLK
jgi:4-amino-4-deoxy-L-arabinose transferase-like glycosyltransferase